MTLKEEDVSVGEDSLDALAEEFIARYRGGERPAISEYQARFPEFADDIRELFPALIMMEDARPAVSPQSDTGCAIPNVLGGRKLERLGDYRILREVGRGGMGIVYEAEQESLGRHVALKVLPTHALLDPRHLQRFAREARAAARLHHTNIVPVFGVGEQDGLHYYVMQFIQGLGLDAVLVELKRLRNAKRSSPHDSALETPDATLAAGAAASSRADSAPALSAHIAAQCLLSGEFGPAGKTIDAAAVTEGYSDASLRVRASGDSSATNFQMPGQSPHSTLSETGRQYWQGVGRIGVQVADALEYASSQGVLHRDIKPSNLLLDTQGTVWVTDFGLAKTTSAFGGDSEGHAADLTHTGDIVGTLRYLAPERLRGQSDQRSDIYALGVTLYEMVTRRPAFEESDRARLVHAIAQEEPRRPRTLEPEVPLDLETIVLKAIAKEPADRYATAHELASDLRRFLEDKPIRARRASAMERTWRWSRRNPLVASLGASLVALVAVLGAGLAVGYLLRTERDRAVVGELRAKHAEGAISVLLDRALSAERDVKIRSHLAQAVAYRRSGQVGRRHKCLDEVAQAVALGPSQSLRDELRNEAIASMALVDIRVIDAPTVPFKPDLAVDGSYRFFAYCDEQMKIQVGRIAGLNGTGTTEFAGIGASDTVLGFSPMGRYIGAGSMTAGRCQIWEVDSGRTVFGTPRDGQIAAFSADESRVAMNISSSLVAVHELTSGKEIARLATDAVPSFIALDSSGRRVAVALSRPSSVQIWELDSNSVVAEFRDFTVPIHSVSWSPDSRSLIVSLAWPASRAEIWDTVTRTRVSTFEGHSQDVVFSKFLNAGRLIVTGSWDGTARISDALTQQLLLVLPGGVNLINVDSEDRRIGHRWTRTMLQCIELSAGPEYRTLLSSMGAGNGEYRDGGISPDGRLLAVGMDDGVRFWDLPSGREVAYLPIEMTPSVNFAPGRDELITSGHGGLQRWPLETMTGTNTVRIGPPRAVSIPFVPTYLHSTPDGRTSGVASVRANEAVLVDLATETVRKMKPASQTDRVVPSPDGRWVAISGWHSRSIEVWDAQSVQVVKQFPFSTHAYVAFSPDSQQLVTSTPSEFRLWEVGTWRELRTIPRENCPYPGFVAFSPDHKLMALELASAVVSLVDVATGRTLAKLEDPHRDRPGWMGFTPDGSRLVIVAPYARQIHVWELGSIREQLRAMDLDWATDSIPTGEAAITEPATQYTVELGGLAERTENLRAARQARTQFDLARMHWRSQHWLEAVAASKRAVELRPDISMYRNSLAWLLATCPDPQFRDAPLAAEHAVRAVELARDSAPAWNTLGVAQYRVGKWQAAIDALTKSEQLQPGNDFGNNAFFLAMAHWQLDEPVPARDWFNQAVKWVTQRESGPRERDELERFRVEAAELMLKPPEKRQSDPSKD